jgi:hypothetical protein
MTVRRDEQRKSHHRALARQKRSVSPFAKEGGVLLAMLPDGVGAEWRDECGCSLSAYEEIEEN